jgi:hypothetical protein
MGSSKYQWLWNGGMPPQLEEPAEKKVELFQKHMLPSLMQSNELTLSIYRISNIVNVNNTYLFW